MSLNAVIQTPIEDTSAEKCRDRIREILEVELDYQYEANYNPYAQVTEVVIERTNPVDIVEESYINISIDSETYSQKDRRGSRTATVTINIDVFANSPTTATQRGDSEAKKKCTRLLSMCSYILDDPQYKTLGFNPGFIHTTAVENFEMADSEKYDGKNSAMGRLVFSATVTEVNALIEANDWQGSNTTNYMNNTNKGIQYEQDAT
jgi:hypothetical protein